MSHPEQQVLHKIKGQSFDVFLEHFNNSIAIEIDGKYQTKIRKVWEGSMFKEIYYN